MEKIPAMIATIADAYCTTGRVCAAKAMTPELTEVAPVAVPAFTMWSVPVVMSHLFKLRGCLCDGEGIYRDIPNEFKLPPV